jgi:hypothetical protein
MGGPARSTLLLSGADRRLESSPLNRQNASRLPSEVLYSPSRGETIAFAVDGEWQAEPEAVDDWTQARFDEQVEQRREQLLSQLDLTGRANAAFADAAGLDVSKVPPELVRELKQTAERMSKDEPPPLPDE